MRQWKTAAIVLGLLVLAGCAGGPESRWAAAGAPPAGFFAGLWHGILMVVTLVVSFFTDDVRIYEVHNVGVAYDLGFVLGALGAYGGGIHVSIGRRRRR